jgi:hypothetical protein
MPTRGRPRKPDAPRKPSGRLAVTFDMGHPMVLQHRAAEVGELHAGSKYAASVIGRLLLAGCFFDAGADRDKEESIEKAQHRHDVLFEFAKMHYWLYGPGSAPSHLRNIGVRLPAGVEAAGDPVALTAKYRDWYSAAILIPPGKSRLLAQQVLERAVLYEMTPATVAELQLLVRIADRLIELDDAAHGRRQSKAKPERRERRDKLAIYNRFVPTDDEYRAWVARSHDMIDTGASREELRSARDAFWRGEAG